MKTFEEACKETFVHALTEDDTIKALARGEEIVDKHRELIEEISASPFMQDMVHNYMNVFTNQIASAIVSAFAQGVVIGMLMEKQDGAIE